MRQIKTIFSISAGVAAGLLVVWLVASRRLSWPLALTMVAAPQPAPAQNVVARGPTVIEVTPTILRENVIRLGINLGPETYWDSQQILKNLLSQNPGFEGAQWQSVLKCGSPTMASCTDGNNDGSWPEGFLDGGQYEVITGAATGETGAIVHSSAASSHTGATVQFAPTQLDRPAQSAPVIKPIKEGDLFVVRKVMPGDAISGWSLYQNGGANVTTEFKDLSPKTPGKQAIRLSAARPGQFISLATFFNASTFHSYVQMRGPYRLRFRAKGISGNRSLAFKIQRLGTGAAIFDEGVNLTSSWQDYTFDFTATDAPETIGSVGLTFSVSSSEVLLDDVSLEENTTNGTAFRDSVLSTLQRLRPGVLRYMDSGQNYGSSLDNLLAPQQARQRTGFSRYGTATADIPIGLQDFLVLCERLGAEPWFTIPIGVSTQDAANLMEYLGGPVNTRYGAGRAAFGHPVPWTQTFARIHLEYANEAWDTSRAGASIADPPAYASRATTVFKTLRASPYYSSNRFNLIANGLYVWWGYTTTLLQTMQGVDTIDIGPYTFNYFGDDSSIEHIFGPMLAEPQMQDDTVNGLVHLQAHAVATAAHPVHLAVYETNIGTIDGTATQASVDSTIPSLGAGISTSLHELLMLRDLGVTVQNTFQLGGGRFPFHSANGTDKDETSPVWGVVVDMGGATNRVRPSFLAQQLANAAIRPTMLTTNLKGEDPMWDQPLSANNKIQLPHVHELQSFAFNDAASSTLIVMNLSRTTAHSIGLAGSCAPQGDVKIQTLTSAKIIDTNELQENVKIVTREQPQVVPGTTRFSLPPFSVTSFSSGNHGCMPVR